MQREAKATHLGMLHQFQALRAKGMLGEAVYALIPSLNDRCTLVEVTLTNFVSE